MYNREKRIGGLIIRVRTQRVVDREFEPRSCRTNDYEIGIYSVADLGQMRLCAS